MTKEDIGIMVGLAVAGAAGIALAATGLAWERPIETVASSITGKTGVGCATIGIGWTAINWGRGTEHGKEWFIGTSMSVGGTLGAGIIVNTLYGGAAASGLLPAQVLPLAAFLSDLVGELLGHGVYAAWVYGGMLLPLMWARRA